MQDDVCCGRCLIVQMILLIRVKEIYYIQLFFLGHRMDLYLAMKKRAPGWLGYIGDEILPNYIGIIISHYKDPY